MSYPGRMTQQSKESAFLTPEQNRFIADLVGGESRVLQAAVVQFMGSAPPDHAEWIPLLDGVATITKDNGRRCLFIQIFNLDTNIKEYEFTFNSKLFYFMTSKTFHQFGQMQRYGMHFYYECEAEEFHNEIVRRSKSRSNATARNETRHPPISKELTAIDARTPQQPEVSQKKRSPGFIRRMFTSKHQNNKQSYASHSSQVAKSELFAVHADDDDAEYAETSGLMINRDNSNVVQSNPPRVANPNSNSKEKPPSFIRELINSKQTSKQSVQTSHIATSMSYHNETQIMESSNSDEIYEDAGDLFHNQKNFAAVPNHRIGPALTTTHLPPTQQHHFQHQTPNAKWRPPTPKEHMTDWKHPSQIMNELGHNGKLKQHNHANETSFQPQQRLLQHQVSKKTISEEYNEIYADVAVNDEIYHDVEQHTKGRPPANNWNQQYNNRPLATGASLVDRSSDRNMSSTAPIMKTRAVSPYMPHTSSQIPNIPQHHATNNQNHRIPSHSHQFDKKNSIEIVSKVQQQVNIITSVSHEIHDYADPNMMEDVPIYSDAKDYRIPEPKPQSAYNRRPPTETRHHESVNLNKPDRMNSDFTHLNINAQKFPPKNTRENQFPKPPNLPSAPNSSSVTFEAYAASQSEAAMSLSMQTHGHYDEREQYTSKAPPVPMGPKSNTSTDGRTPLFPSPPKPPHGRSPANPGKLQTPLFETFDLPPPPSFTGLPPNDDQSSEDETELSSMLQAIRKKEFKLKPVKVNQKPSHSGNPAIEMIKAAVEKRGKAIQIESDPEFSSDDTDWED